MRIVAGSVKGHPLRVPQGREVRPTADRVRESLFSILGEEVSGARVLDAFAGSGALGLEALSRGASAAVFVERSRRVRQVLELNVQALRFADRCRIMGGDAMSAMDATGTIGSLRFFLACFISCRPPRRRAWR